MEHLKRIAGNCLDISTQHFLSFFGKGQDSVQYYEREPQERYAYGAYSIAFASFGNYISYSTVAAKKSLPRIFI